MTPEFAIRTTSLSKHYGSVRAIADVNMAIPHGTICALIGRNGAGKTTMIRTLLGMVHPTSGSGEVLGLAINTPDTSVAIRRRVAFVDPVALYPWMTVAEILKFARECYPDWNRAREVAGIFALDLLQTQKVAELSKGTRTKLAVLLSLARDAEVLFFDEPTDGLDPVVREQVLQALVAINATRGATILVSSHQLSELDDVANWLCVMDRGSLVLQGEMDAVRAGHQRIDLRVEGAAGAMLAAIPGVLSVTRQGEFATVIVSGDIESSLQSVGATVIKRQPATLKEIVLGYAAADLGNSQWVLQGMRDVA